MVSTAPRPITKPKQQLNRVSQGGGNRGGNLSAGVLFAVWGSVLLGMGAQSILTYQQLLERTRSELQQVATLKATTLQNLKESDLASFSLLKTDKAIGARGYFVVIKRTDEGDQVVAQPEGIPAPSLQGIPQDDSASLTQLGADLIAYSSAIPVAGNLKEKLRVMAVVPESVVRDQFVQTSLLTTTGTAILLSLVILWFVSYLNRRLKPLVNQCEEATAQRGGTGISGSGSSLDRLESALYQMVQQIDRYEEELKLETTQVVQAQERQKIAIEMQQEQEASEQEVGILLEVVSSIEEGDLTVEAEVSDRATGLVADTLNRLRERLAETIARVLATAQQVALGAEELQTLARTVAANTVEQAQSVAQGRALTEQVANSAQSSADQVKIANQALQEVQKTVEAAQTAISKLTEGIGVLQKGSAQIVQRMKTLGEFVGLAEQFVQDQSQIASLTQVLAINATLVAARAAEQRDPKQFIGVAREFEAIAEQVNSLATQTNQGLTVLRQRTGQIQAVVSAVDTEVQGLGGLVAGFTSGVEQSATAFQSVRQVTSQVVGVGQGVTESSLEIATAAGSTAKYMSEIATLADQTADLTSTARYQAETMGSIAQELLTGIRFFRLPEAMVATADQLAQAVEQVTVDAGSAEVIAGAELIEEWEYEDELDYEDTSATIAQLEDEEELPFLPTGGKSLDDLDEMETFTEAPVVFAMEALVPENIEFTPEAEMEALPQLAVSPAEDFDADELSGTELEDLEFSDPNYTKAPTLHLGKTEPPTLIEQAEPGLDFDMVQDELSADDFGISLEAIEEDLETPEDFSLDAEDVLENEIEEMINPLAQTVVDGEAYLDVFEQVEDEIDVEIELEEMVDPLTEVVIESEGYQTFSPESEDDLEISLEDQAINPLSETIIDLVEETEDDTVFQQVTLMEDELEFTLLESEPEAAPISADFDAHFDALVSSFTEIEEDPSRDDVHLEDLSEAETVKALAQTQFPESTDQVPIDAYDTDIDSEEELVSFVPEVGISEETIDAYGTDIDSEEELVSFVPEVGISEETIDAYGTDIDSEEELVSFVPEAGISEETIDILMEAEVSDNLHQETINQIFELELINDEPTPFATDALAELSDDRDKANEDQPFRVSGDEQITAPLIPAGLMDGDKAFLIDENVDINQPDLSIDELENEPEMKSLSLELLEANDDPLQELMDLSERLDDSLLDSYRQNATEELEEDADGNLDDELDDFLPVFANSNPHNDPDPFDFDLLSEETI